MPLSTIPKNYDAEINRLQNQINTLRQLTKKQVIEINYLKSGVAEVLETDIAMLRQQLAVIEDGLDADKAMTKALAQVDANTIAELRQQLAEQENIRHWTMQEYETKKTWFDDNCFMVEKTFIKG